jgi:3-hydroxyisobutyrate dehydrogenase-like beta-hydroxyacid dehydrogenase
MKKVAVIGLGIMGHGIADNFLKNGYEVIAWNRTSDKTKDLIAKGARLAKSPKDASEQADVVFEVTADDESSRKVWLGDDGILAGAKPGQFVVTCATLSVDWVNELAKHCEAKHLNFFDMPMTGSRVGAETGQLVLFVGGDENTLHDIRQDLSAIAKDVKYFGAIGSGTKYKLILNTLQAIHIAGMGQALRMAKAVGLDERKTAEALMERPGGVVTKIAWESYLQQPDPITFSVEWITKDLGYALKMLDEQAYPLLEDVLKIYKEAIEKGLSQADWTKINDS